jgi:hypothetical protein
MGLITDNLGKLDRLMHGNFQRIEQAKNDIIQLKEKRALIHREEEEQLRRQALADNTSDLAREARFLSNLCISLEANSILHLANVWPTQKQVRKRLKAQNSRYFAGDRNYRVYRFRKVADTQSQMVLDLIMEAAREARREEEAGRGSAGARRIDENAGENVAEPVPASVRAGGAEQNHDISSLSDRLEQENEQIRREDERRSQESRARLQGMLDSLGKGLGVAAGGFVRAPDVEEAQIIDPQKVRRDADGHSRQIKQIFAASDAKGENVAGNASVQDLQRKIESELAGGHRPEADDRPAPVVMFDDEGDVNGAPGADDSPSSRSVAAQPAAAASNEPETERVTGEYEYEAGQAGGRNLSSHHEEGAREARMASLQERVAGLGSSLPAAEGRGENGKPYDPVELDAANNVNQDIAEASPVANLKDEPSFPPLRAVPPDTMEFKSEEEKVEWGDKPDFLGGQKRDDDEPFMAPAGQGDVASDIMSEMDEERGAEFIAKTLEKLNTHKK